MIKLGKKKHFLNYIINFYLQVMPIYHQSNAGLHFKHLFLPLLEFFHSHYIRNANILQDQPGGKGEHCQNADYGYSTLLTTVFPVRLTGYTKQLGDVSKNILNLMK